MSPGLFGLILLLTISVLCAAVAHARIPQFLRAVAISAPLAGFLFFILVITFDKPGALVGLVPCFATLYSIPVAVLVGLPIAWYRWQQRPIPRHCRKCRYDLTGNTSDVCPECGERI